ncbi:Cytochrome P450 superfamily protein [Abortiporus biennis]
MPAFNINMLVAISGVTTYFIYHRLEPTSPLVALALLVILPAFVAYDVQSQFSSIITAIPIVFGSYWALILTLTLGYRVSPIHPLAQYPGPVLCKLTNSWVMYQTLIGQHHRYIAELHRKYGDVVRIGPNELSFNRASTVSPILKGLTKSQYYDTRIQEGAMQLDGIKDLNFHASRRKNWTKAMNSQALKEYSEIVQAKTEELMEALKARQGETLNISQWLGFFSFDFMGLMAFSFDFGMVKAGADLSGFGGVLERGTFEAGLISYIPWILPTLSLIPGGAKSLIFLQNFGVKTATKRMSEGSNKKDLWSYLINEDGQSTNKMKPEEVTADGMLAIIAGSDTTAAALSHVLYFLLENPHCYDRLRDEVDNAFSTGEALESAKLAELSYLNGCLNEALRLYPPVMFGLPRKVPEGGKILGEFYVPGGTTVSAHTFSIHRDPRNFYPIPDKFWPDRWISKTIYELPTGETINAEQLIHDKEVFMPFSIGQQSCAGKGLAIMEMRYVLATFIQQFEMSVADGYRLKSWEDNLIDVYITHHGPLEITLKARY